MAAQPLDPEPKGPKEDNPRDPRDGTQGDPRGRDRRSALGEIASCFTPWYIALLGRDLLGVASDGSLLWSSDAFPFRISAHAIIVPQDMLFCAGGYDAAIVLFKMVPRDKGIRLEQRYRERVPLNAIQDSSVPVLVGEQVYELGRGGQLLCIDFKTGKVLWRPRAQFHTADGQTFTWTNKNWPGKLGERVTVTGRAVTIITIPVFAIEPNFVAEFTPSIWAGRSLTWVTGRMEFIQPWDAAAIQWGTYAVNYSLKILWGGPDLI